jgi:hypothetical protein
MWHPSRNYLTADDVTSHSNKVVWWRCTKNKKHEWKAQVNTVVNHIAAGHGGCPFCSGRRASEDGNLAVQYPELIKLWHKRLNMPLRPTQVTFGSGKYVWWQCPKNGEHIWQAQICSTVRSYLKGCSGCPKCLRTKP